MGEVLAILESIKVAVELGERVSRYVEGVRDAEKERHRWLNEIEDANDVLKGLRNILCECSEDSKLFSTIRKQQRPGGTIHEYERVLTEIVTVLDNRKEKKQQDVRWKLFWPLVRIKIEELYGKIRPLKDNIHLALAMDHTSLSLRMYNHLHPRQNATQSDDSNQSARIDLLKEPNTSVVETKEASQPMYTRYGNEANPSYQARQISSCASYHTLDEAARLIESQESDEVTFFERIGTGHGPVSDNFHFNRLGGLLDWKVKGTGEWFLQSPEFQDWQNGGSHTLYCPGQAGSGKSMIAATAIAHLRQHLRACDAVTYAFCRTGMTRNLKATILTTILKQLSAWKTPAAQAVNTVLEDADTHQSDLQAKNLPQALRATASRFSKISIVIDALESCSADGLSRLLVALGELRACVDLRILATSQRNSDVREKLHADMELEIIAHPKDIELYFDSEVVNHDMFTKAHVLRQEALSRIIDHSGGIFWKAVFDIRALNCKLEGTITEQTVQAFLNTIPSNSTAEEYERSVQRIQAQAPGDVKLAMKALLWLYMTRTWSFEPSEFQHAMAYNPGETIPGPDDVLDLDAILAVCGGLVSFNRATNSVELSHSEVQEYLDQNFTTLFPEGSLQSASWCTSYLSLVESPDLPKWMRNEDEKLESVWSTLRRKYLLLTYAIHEWGYLVSDAEAKGQLTATLRAQTFQLLERVDLRRLCNFLATDPATYFDGTFDGEDGPRFDFSPVNTAAYFSLEFAVEKLLRDNANVKEEPEDQTPLIVATRNGRERMVRLLLDSRPKNLDHVPMNGSSALSYAVEAGNSSIVRMLLDSGADPDLPAKLGETPLMCAVSRGDIEIGSILLASGRTSVNQTDNDGQSAMHKAILAGDLAFVKLLLGTNIHFVQALERKLGDKVFDAIPINRQSSPWRDVDKTVFQMFRNREGRTLVSFAALHGKAEILEILLELPDADVNHENDERKTPLALAAFQGYTAAVELILDDERTGIESRDRYGETPIFGAVRGSYLLTIKVLLKKGAKINVVNEAGATPLEIAISDEAPYELVDLLAEHRVMGHADRRRAVSEQNRLVCLTSGKLSRLVYEFIYTYRLDLECFGSWDQFVPETLTAKVRGLDHGQALMDRIVYHRRVLNLLLERFDPSAHDIGDSVNQKTDAALHASEKLLTWYSADEFDRYLKQYDLEGSSAQPLKSDMRLQKLDRNPRPDHKSAIHQLFCAIAHIHPSGDIDSALDLIAQVITC